MAKENFICINDNAEERKGLDVPRDLLRDIEVKITDKVYALTLCDCTGECSCADACGAR